MTSRGEREFFFPKLPLPPPHTQNNQTGEGRINGPHSRSCVEHKGGGGRKKKEMGRLTQARLSGFFFYPRRSRQVIECNELLFFLLLMQSWSILCAHLKLTLFKLGTSLKPYLAAQVFEESLFLFFSSLLCPGMVGGMGWVGWWLLAVVTLGKNQLIKGASGPYRRLVRS